MTAAEPVSPVRLDWPDCVNVRDLAGVPAGDGRAVRRGALVRSDSLHRLTKAGRGLLAAYGVSRVVDLRGPGELAELPSPFAAEPALYRNVSVQGPDDPPDDGYDDLTTLYRGMLERNRARYAVAVAAVADAPPGAVVVHCAGGKDRTGLVVAFALTLAGVPFDAVLADYVATQDALPALNFYFDGLGPRDLARARALHGRMEPEVLISTYAWLQRTYGGVESYLSGGGLSERACAALPTRLLA